MMSRGLLNLLNVNPEGNGVSDTRTMLENGDIDPQQATLLSGLLGMEAPIDPGNSFREYMARQDGAKGFFGSALNPLLSRMMFSDDYNNFENARANYATDAAQYKLLSGIAAGELQDQIKASRVGNLGQAVIDARATPDTNDDLVAYNNYLAGGGTSEGLTRIAGKMPEYQVIDNNGTPTLIDKNNPHSLGITLKDKNGVLRNPLPQHQVDQVGAFDRMVPRLQELDEMEQAGMSIPRSTMTKLRAYETADADGNRVLSAMGLEKWMAETLTPEQRQYILAAEDAGMIVLRDESGAAISASEILRQMNQYLIFDDLSDEAFEAQRNARNRKGRSLATGLPNWLLEDEARSSNLEWVNSFDGKRRPKPQQPSVLEEEGLVPSTGAPAPYRPAPQAAVDKLRQNPDLATAFQQKYGYLPEGI